MSVANYMNRQPPVDSRFGCRGSSQPETIEQLVAITFAVHGIVRRSLAQALLIAAAARTSRYSTCPARITSSISTSLNGRPSIVDSGLMTISNTHPARSSSYQSPPGLVVTQARRGQNHLDIQRSKGPFSMLMVLVPALKVKQLSLRQLIGRL